MLIKCPKCELIYKIDDALMTDKGLKMRCHHCGEVFKAYSRDGLLEEEEKVAQKENVTKHFKQMLNPNHDVFQPTIARQSDVRVVHLTHYKNSINYLFLLFILMLSAALLYVLRYDVVKYVPKAEKFYQKLGVQSVYYGKNLEFTRIKTSEFIDNSVSKIKMSGIIRNPSDYVVDVPPIKVIIYNEDGTKILDTTHYLPQNRVGAYYQIPFSFVLTNPTPKQKNIHIVFADNL